MTSTDLLDASQDVSVGLTGTLSVTIGGRKHTVSVTVESWRFASDPDVPDSNAGYQFSTGDPAAQDAAEAAVGPVVAMLRAALVAAVTVDAT